MQIQENAELRNLNSFKTGGLARYYTEITNIEDLKNVLEFAKNKDLKTFILGGGTNTIFSQDFAGLVIKIALKEVKIEENTITVGAGEIWDNFVLLGLKNGLYGLENLSWIPGSVGASPVQNIGAYGVEAKDYITEVRCFDVEQNKVVNFSNSECKFAYRDSIFKHDKNLIILEVVYTLDTEFAAKNTYGELKGIDFKDAFEVRNKIIEIRKNKLPDWSTVRNSGSFFKNPIVDKNIIDNLLSRHPDLIYFPNGEMYKISAGYLIEKFFNKRGYINENSVGLWHNQALVLYAENNVTTKDIIKFSEDIINKIYKSVGITLEREVNII